MIKFFDKGIIATWVLTFAVAMLIMLGGIVGFVLLQQKVSVERMASEESLHIAEAGINYFKWYVNQNSTTTQEIIQDGNNWCTSTDTISVCGSNDWCGPYEHDYKDTNGNVIGRFKLCTKGKVVCGQILGAFAKSIGYTNKYQNIKRTIQAKFAATTIAEYAYLVHESVWVGDDRSIYGKYHSNGGIHMDGTGNSLVTSAVGTFLCTKSLGCNPPNCDSECTHEGDACRCPGVYGSGGGSDLWKNGVLPFNFDGITSDFSKIKTLANNNGRYYEKSINIDDKADGYHFIFKDDGTYDVKIITELKDINSSDGNNFAWRPEIIKSEYTYKSNVTTSDTCGLIFAEDNVWVEGTIKGRKTLATANLVDSNIQTSAIINWDIDYTNLDGSDSFALLAEQDILIPLCSPGGGGDTVDNPLCGRSGTTTRMTMRGVFVAQNGRIGRNYYPQSKKNGNKWESYKPWCFRDDLLIYGSVVSRKRVGTKWICEWGYCSGYEDRTNYFDQKLATNPPPLLPYISPDLKIVSWEELQ